MPFMRFEDIVYLLGFIGQAPQGYRVFLGGAFLIIFCISFLMFRLSFFTNKLGILFQFNLLIVYYLCVSLVTGDFSKKNQFWRSSPDSLVASQVAFFYASRSSFFIADFYSDASSLVAFDGKAASDFWRDESVSGNLSPRLLLIVAESWGVARDERIQDEVLASVAVLDGFHLSKGDVSFEGVTVGGELRELCRLVPRSLNISSAGKYLSNCLPSQLTRSGYTAASLHGAAGSMYDRRTWYPQAGFVRSDFLETLTPSRFCFSFPGACDLDLFDKVRIFFSSPGKKFFYWLTLNSHSLYDERDIFIDRFNCKKFGLSIEMESCRNLKLQTQFFDGLAGLLKDPSMSGVDVLVVGDHEPKIFNGRDYASVFKDGLVPWVRIESRKLN